MIFKIIQNELRSRFKMISTYVYFFLFFSLSFLIMNIAGGAIPGAAVNSFKNGENIIANSPVMLNMLTVVIFYFGLIVVASIFGNSAVKEFEENSFSLFFTKPIKKFTYISGKFLAGMIINLFIFSAIGMGFFLGSLMPYLEPHKIGANHLMAYLQPYFLFLIPDLLFTGAIFFMLALHSRKVINAYIGGIVLFFGYLASSSLSSDYTNMKLVSLLDPFGISSVMLIVRYWSADQLNNNMLSFSGDILYNRLLWISVALTIFFVFLKLFKMTHSMDKKAKEQKIKNNTTAKTPEITKINDLKQNFNKILYPLYRWTKYEFKGIISNYYFYIILLGYLFFLITTATQIGKIFGTTTYPVTHIMTEMLTGSFLLFTIIISTFYAGELVWKERINKSDQIIDAMPFKNGIAFFSKLFAILLVQIIFIVMIMLVGIITQLAQGYYQINFTHYLFDLFVLRFPSIIVYAFLAMFMQVIFNNKYFAYFAVIGFYGLNMVLGMLSIDHNLLLFNGSPGISFSDMNKYGHYLPEFFSFKLYWFLFSLILALFALMMWSRGKETLLKFRFKQAINNKSKTLYRTMILTAIMFTLTGALLFYNTNIINEYHMSKTYDKINAKYEKKYKYLEKFKQPRITDVNVQLDLTPSSRDLKIKGYYILKNKTNASIKNLIVYHYPDIKDYKISYSQENSLIQEDKYFGLQIYALNKALAPGDSIKLEFSGSYREKGIKNEGGSRSLINNGTFLHNNFFPSIGYADNFEIQDNDTRKKHGLAPKERMAKLSDIKARNNVYISSDADWVNFECVISTEKDQIAIAPGDLLKEWTEGNRHYYHYKLNSPVLNFFTFVSGKYEVKKDQINGITVEVYYHKDHPYNIDSMIDAAKHSLDYCIKNFNYYPHKVLRIVEVPRYVSYAQSIPTMIPFSEGIGFIADVKEDDPKDINYPYYITAHEVAHQWWAHQVIGANVQGSTLLSEAFAQYTSLMCMKEKYGKDKMGRFLGYELDSYLMGRSNESKKELPIYLVENQQYIHYNKGSLVMYSIQDLIGEDKVNTALGNFCKNYAFKNPPYPVSTDFLPYIYAQVPDSLQNNAKDLFEKIVLLDFGIKDMKINPIKDNKYQIILNTENKKVEADSLGKENEVNLKEYVDIAIYEKDKEQPIKVEKVRIQQKNQQITLISDVKPEKVVLDPYRQLIDRNRDNNEKNLNNKDKKNEKARAKVKIAS